MLQHLDSRVRDMLRRVLALKIGVTPWLDDWNGPAQALAEQAEFAEELGFHSFWLPESHFTGHGAIPAPLLQLSAIASRTRTLKIGTTSYLLPVRHPIAVAEEVAVLDRLSGGRVILGVGRGFRRALFRVYEVPVREKRDRFEAALAAMRDAWSGEPIAWEDEDDPASQPIRVSPLPVQKPHPPIWVAGFGPKAVAQCGRLGLPYLASPIESMARLVENYGRQREAMSAESRAQDLAVPIMRTVFVSSDEALCDRVRSGLAAQAAALGSAQVASIRSAADASVEDWAIVGHPDAVAEQIGVYQAKLGMTHLIARGQVPGADGAAVETSLRALAEIAASSGD
jgi:alkanesulfonate monooxygenase SsuD/methylene tetrahydromethanopterin reductase-like flavin-dependent oxidoreductase (luciferase family)